MQVGAIFPQTEIGNDPIAIRDYAQAAEALGYRHILAYDHVLGAGLAGRPGWRGPYNSDTPFHEPFVLFAYLAGQTRTIGFTTGVIVLPQRQTALVAKQAAALDVLSGGRLRLGVGTGWNEVEYQALGENFGNRGARSEEQIAVLRALWSAPVVTFHGRWHTIEAAGINPLPLQRPIPLWIGGYVNAVIERAGRLADGWFPAGPPNDQARANVERLRAAAAAAGRAADAVGIEARLSLNQTPEGAAATFAAGWSALGATHLSVNTMGMGFRSPQQHIDALRRMAATLGVLPASSL
ncbi:MAG: LLM class F420-dependent oxidoreductase [Kouleothrix sp.]|jgi:probable F420-dependent oxidoreductase|nr:LLM class F420-dependent oxidoreductase [Kouleothrix sp.]